MNKNRQTVSRAKAPAVILLTVLTVLAASNAHAADASAKAPANKKKLKIVFMLGQSNMVGMCNPITARYLIEPMYIPPVKAAVGKSRYFDESYFFWQGMSYGYGSEEFNDRGRALLEERKASRKRWRQLVYGNFSRNPTRNDWLPEYGPAPKTGKKYMYPFLDMKAQAEGIYKRMGEHIESPENKFHPKAAYEELCKRDQLIAGDIKRADNIFLKNAKPEDFDRLAEVLKDKAKRPTSRASYAELLRKYVNMPIATRTQISALGAVSGQQTDHEYTRVAHGPLSVGYGKSTNMMGPEYGFGITFEQLVDGPVLLVKCSWGGTSVMSNWRPPSLSNTETPIEKATRQTANKAAAEAAKKAGIEFKPKQPQSGTGACWKRTMAHIRKVLADPGKYHPDYDPKAGYELVGLVWFQGWNDMGNKAYGEQLVTFVKDFRKEMKQPDLPVVCGLLGHNAWKHTTFNGDVNSGMLYAARDAKLKGTVDIVNTVKYFPIELGFRNSVQAACGKDSAEYKKIEQVIKRASSNFGFHYYGSAKFFLLAGDAMARSLANLVKGGEPTIHAEAESILQPKH